ncbi:MAG: benzoate/H(+) symporter BenE family transporter [Alphaproteobacteria bacterium]|nr:benzoate/H(+) symporter BenE family transporter [Alphaproteobacteria bacterium]
MWLPAAVFFCRRWSIGQTPDVPLSLFTQPLIAAIAGFGGTLAIVLAAAAAMGADAAQTASWVAAISLFKALSGAWLSWRYRMPFVCAWSTPGAALLAASAAPAGFEVAVGAFVVTAGLILLTAAIAPLARLIERLPASIASAMLAGILLRLVAGMVEHLPRAPALVLSMIAAFLVVRLFWPTLASLVALALGAAIAFAAGGVGSVPAVQLSTLVWVRPSFDLAALLGLALPLYLVTMASQNLPGFAVLRASGYAPPVTPALAATGLASLASAFFGAHTSNLAAISAALCTGPDTHPDPARRWLAGLVYAFYWLLIAAFGASLVGFFLALPPALLATVAGLALLGSLAGALSASMAAEPERLAAAATVAVTVSGVTVLGIGSAFWGLAAGLIVLGADRLVRR